MKKIFTIMSMKTVYIHTHTHIANSPFIRNKINNNYIDIHQPAVHLETSKNPVSILKRKLHVHTHYLFIIIITVSPSLCVVSVIKNSLISDNAYMHQRGIMTFGQCSWKNFLGIILSSMQSNEEMILATFCIIA